MGLSSDEFFESTPRQICLLLDQHSARQERIELLAGIVASTVANYSMGAPKKAAVPADFMPSRIGRGRSKSPATHISKQRKQVASDLRAFFNGIIEKQNRVTHK